MEKFKVNVELFKVAMMNIYHAQILNEKKQYHAICGVPRGGIYVAIMLSNISGIKLIDIEDLDSTAGNILVCDDIIDSGKTRRMYNKYDFVCIAMKHRFAMTLEQEMEGQIYCYEIMRKNQWVEFFWESKELPAEDSVIRLIQMIGDDPNREGLVETPKRFIKAYNYIFDGYNMEIDSVLKTFIEDRFDEIVLLKDIEFYSMCEHHMLPFFGKAHIAYIPNGKILGVSKLARILEIFTRRLQIQERIGKQITSVLMNRLGAKGAACILEAKHMCMTMRGIEKQNSIMTTSSMEGVFMGNTTENLAARNELMALIK